METTGTTGTRHIEQAEIQEALKEAEKNRIAREKQANTNTTVTESQKTDDRPLMRKLIEGPATKDGKGVEGGDQERGGNQVG